MKNKKLKAKVISILVQNGPTSKTEAACVQINIDAFVSIKPSSVGKFVEGNSYEFMVKDVFQIKQPSH